MEYTTPLTSLNTNGDIESSERIDGAQLTLEEDGTWSEFLEVDDDDVKPEVATDKSESLFNGQIVIFILDENNVEEECRVVKNKETKEVQKSIKIVCTATLDKTDWYA